MVKDRLTHKQRRFVDEYLYDLNATQAATRAGYSKKTAYSQGQRLLKNVEVHTAIQKAQAERAERMKINSDWVLKRLVDEAEANLADLYDRKTGHLKSVHEWPEIWRQGLVSGLDVTTSTIEDETTNTITKVRLSDRIKRLELIGRHVNIQAFKDRVDAAIPGLKEVMEAVAGASRGLPSGEKPGD
jgi:phage terminase small subunit